MIQNLTNKVERVRKSGKTPENLMQAAGVRLKRPFRSGIETDACAEDQQLGMTVAGTAAAQIARNRRARRTRAAAAKQ